MTDVSYSVTVSTKTKKWNVSIGDVDFYFNGVRTQSSACFVNATNVMKSFFKFNFKKALQKGNV